MIRKPLSPGIKYRFPNSPNWIKINWFTFPHTKDYNGGLPGVSVTWSDYKTIFYPFESEELFWSFYLFSNLIDF